VYFSLRGNDTRSPSAAAAVTDIAMDTKSNKNKIFGIANRVFPSADRLEQQLARVSMQFDKEDASLTHRDSNPPDGGTASSASLASSPSSGLLRRRIGI